MFLVLLGANETLHPIASEPVCIDGNVTATGIEEIDRNTKNNDTFSLTGSNVPDRSSWKHNLLSWCSLASRPTVRGVRLSLPEGRNCLQSIPLSNNCHRVLSILVPSPSRVFPTVILALLQAGVHGAA
jgi:hypothetical protein